MILDIILGADRPSLSKKWTQWTVRICELGPKWTVLKARVMAKVYYKMDQSGRSGVKSGRLQGFRVDGHFNPAHFDPLMRYDHPLFAKTVHFGLDPESAIEGTLIIKLIL